MLNIQIYSSKKNFEVQKAERFFKERNVKYTFIDLTKHNIGKKELDIFVRAAGNAESLINRKDKKLNKHPVALVFTEELIKNAILENSSCLISPIVRNGQKVTIGADEKTWKAWIEE